jgi:hypothetical protein
MLTKSFEGGNKSKIWNVRGFPFCTLHSWQHMPVLIQRCSLWIILAWKKHRRQIIRWKANSYLDLSAQTLHATWHFTLTKVSPFTLTNFHSRRDIYMHVKVGQWQRMAALRVACWAGSGERWVTRIATHKHDLRVHAVHAFVRDSFLKTCTTPYLRPTN